MLQKEKFDTIEHELKRIQIALYSFTKSGARKKLPEKFDTIEHKLKKIQIALYSFTK